MDATLEWLPTAAAFPAASLNLPAVLAVVAAIVLLRFIWAGWRTGVARQLVSVAGLGLAVFVGVSFRRAPVPLIRPLGLPDEVLQFVGGAALAAACYALVLLFSAILLKKTEQQEVRVVWFGYGVFGALIGLGKGLLFIWAVCILLRFIGTAAAVQVALTASPSEPEEADETADARWEGVAKLETVLDRGRLGALLDRIDPVPTTFRRALPKLAQVLRDDESVVRLHDHPKMRKLVNHPKIAAAERDPEVARALSGTDLRTFLANRKVQALLGDPELQAIAKEIDLGMVLDDVLSKKGR